LSGLVYAKLRGTMPAKDRFVEFCIEQFAPLGRIDSRYMFGGWCLYCNGAVFALIADGSLFLKADTHNMPEFEARGLPAFRPFPDKPDTMKYFQAPPEIFEDDDALRHWGGAAIAASLRTKKKKS
jgi:DNA transformation protein and related proteins